MLTSLHRDARSRTLLAIVHAEMNAACGPRTIGSTAPFFGLFGPVRHFERM